MGVRTQVRGWFCLDSIGKPEHYDDALIKLDGVKRAIREDAGMKYTWIVDRLTLARGDNYSLWLFFGSEFKNYGDDIDIMVKYLRIVFPGIEGRLDIQHESKKRGDYSDTWRISREGVFKLQERAWTQGYGLDYREVIQGVVED